MGNNTYDLSDTENDLSQQEQLISCPACGSLVLKTQHKCPKCGLDMESMMKPSSVLLNKLIKAHNKKDKIRIVDEFPIPDSKNELLDLMMVVLYSHFINPEDLLDECFILKYEACLEKAQLYYPNDVDFNKLQEEFDRNKKRVFKAIRKMKPGHKFYVFLIVVLILGVLALIIAAMW